MVSTFYWRTKRICARLIVVTMQRSRIRWPTLFPRRSVLSQRRVHDVLFCVGLRHASRIPQAFGMFDDRRQPGPLLKHFGSIRKRPTSSREFRSLVVWNSGAVVSESWAFLWGRTLLAAAPLSGHVMPRQAALILWPASRGHTWWEGGWYTGDFTSRKDSGER